MTITPENRDWYAQYCNLCAANVLDKQGQVRFDFVDLSTALEAASEGRDDLVPESIDVLRANIVELCNKQKGMQELDTQDWHILMLTLLNTHAAFLMLVKIWRFEDKAGLCESETPGIEIF